MKRKKMGEGHRSDLPALGGENPKHEIINSKSVFIRVVPVALPAYCAHPHTQGYT